MYGDYFILSEGTLKELSLMVCNFIKKGYEPQGGVSFDPKETTYMQAMRKTVSPAI